MHTRGEREVRCGRSEKFMGEKGRGRGTAPNPVADQKTKRRKERTKSYGIVRFHLKSSLSKKGEAN